MRTNLWTKNHTAWNHKSWSEGGWLWSLCRIFHLSENNDVFYGTSWTHYRWEMTKKKKSLVFVMFPSLIVHYWDELWLFQPCMLHAPARQEHIAPRAAGRPCLTAVSWEKASSKTLSRPFFPWCKLHEKKVWSLNNWIFQQGKRTFSYQCKENMNMKNEG